MTASVTQGRFLLGILDENLCKSPEELAGEQNTAAYYETPRAAKEAGRALLARHASPVGFVVRRVFNAGHYRTVATEWRVAK